MKLKKIKKKYYELYWGWVFECFMITGFSTYFSKIVTKGANTWVELAVYLSGQAICLAVALKLNKKELEEMRELKNKINEIKKKKRNNNIYKVQIPMVP